MMCSANLKLSEKTSQEEKHAVVGSFILINFFLLIVWICFSLVLFVLFSLMSVCQSELSSILYVTVTRAVIGLMLIVTSPSVLIPAVLALFSRWFPME